MKLKKDKITFSNKTENVKVSLCATDNKTEYLEN